MDEFKRLSYREINTLEDNLDLNRLGYYFQQVEVEVNKVRLKVAYIAESNGDTSFDDDAEYQEIYSHLKYIEGVVDEVQDKLKYLGNTK